MDLVLIVGIVTSSLGAGTIFFILRWFKKHAGQWVKYKITTILHEAIEPLLQPLFNAISDLRKEHRQYAKKNEEQHEEMKKSINKVDKGLASVDGKLDGHLMTMRTGKEGEPTWKPKQQPGKKSGTD